jgi:hypothetical protein
MKKWAYKSVVATFGLSPFSPSLSDKVRISPEFGPEYSSRSDSLSPSENSESHGANDPFSESDHTVMLSEKAMEEERKKRKKKIAKEKLKKLQEKRELQTSFYSSFKKISSTYFLNISEKQN